jgi:hypothetical protein
MNFMSFRSVLGAALMLVPLNSMAEEESQEQLFKNYQAMVIIEEYNQHCPMLSRLEAEALNGQIVFANSSFAGSMEAVEKFKKEGRIFARRMQCNALELQELYTIASQQASDYLVNHILLARQIHLYDIKNTSEGKGQGGLLLDYMTEEEWGLLDDMYQEVKDNYLSQATQEQWDAFEASVVKVAEERTALRYLESKAALDTGAEGFATVQAKINLKDITNYYFNLEKTVKAFVDGASADERGAPYSRPANDFTGWTAFRPRNENLNWAISYPGCGGRSANIDCTFFTTANSEIGVSLPRSAKEVSIAYRNPNNVDLKTSLKAVEGPIGSNVLNLDNFNANVVETKSADDLITNNGVHHSELNSLSVQTGDVVNQNHNVYLFAKETLDNINKLHKNDVLIVTIKTDDGEVEEKIMPLHNYLRANNWAYSTE